jgi:hypothetical protein
MGEQSVEQSSPEQLEIGMVYEQDYNVETLSGDKTVSYSDAGIQVLDADGAGRNVGLPADQVGQEYVVVNASGGANDLTVRDADDNTIHAVSQNEAARFKNTGSGYVVIGGATASGGQNV